MMGMERMARCMRGVPDNQCGAGQPTNMRAIGQGQVAQQRQNNRPAPYRK